MAFEAENPTRRYKHFRPRQAARGGVGEVTPTNYATFALFNNSTASQLLIVRGVSYAIGSRPPQWGMIEERLTGTPGQTGNYFPSMGALPGLVDYSDQPAILPGDFVDGYSGATNASLPPLPFPLAVIEPGWSFFIQGMITGGGSSAGFIWEAIFPEELDYVWSFE